MLSIPDFDKKQIIVVLAREGEKIRLLNGNLIVMDPEGKTKLQVSCYRLFLILIIGHISLTTAMIQEAAKFGFGFALFTPGFRYYAMIGGLKEGNTLLKEKQYAFQSPELAKHLIRNKIAGQYDALTGQRNKNELIRDAMVSLKGYYAEVSSADSRGTVMAYEGLASKLYFRYFFNDMSWQGRQPRVKRDWINSALDIGYTVLFSFVEALLNAYGFDTYRGILHTQFYMRKSLVCDLVEPFRVLIDAAVKKGYHLSQIGEKDFTIVNHRYELSWANTPKYVKLFLEAILAEKDTIFLYIQQYYRCFMKGTEAERFPFYRKGEVTFGPDQL